MKATIDIEYKSLPKDIVNELFALSQYEIGVNCCFDEEPVEHFDGGPNDILIYINSHLTELMASGLGVNAVYDILKSSIKVIWRKVVQFYRRQKGEYQADKSNISIKFKIKNDSTIEYTLKGNIDEAQINSITDKLFSQIDNLDKFRPFFNGEQYQKPDEEDRYVEMYYDESTNEWQPIDFLKRKKDWDDFIRNIEDDLDSLSS